jgi:hypothetical protein
MTILALIFPQPGVSVWFAVMQVAMVLVTTLIQYAWTFFYLRLVEIESPIVEEGPLLAWEGEGRPRLALVESDRPKDQVEA